MSRLGLTAAALLVVFAGFAVDGLWAQQRAQTRQVVAQQNVPSFPPDTVAPPPANKSTVPQSDAPQAPTQNWALPTPQNNQSQPKPQAAPTPVSTPPQQNQTPASRNQVSPSLAAPATPVSASPRSVTPKAARRGKKAPEPEPVAVVPPPPEQPPQPLRPSQMPPTAPQVAYRDGLLSIVAENSTLADILTAVRKQTGAAIDIPPGAANERVVIHLNAAPPRDVLSALLDGSPFDYVIVGSETNPTALRRVIVNTRQGEGAVPSNTSQVSPPGFQRSPMPGMGAATAEQAEAADQAEEPPQPPQRVAQPIPMPGMGPLTAPTPGATQPGAQPAGTATNPASPPALKTPEQLLEELKRMQQQQQQSQPQPPARPPL
jgi:hypothetical protein